jgi:large subunit ribosomal protein L29
MKAKDLITKEAKELQEMLKETRSSLNRLTFGKTTKALTNHRELRTLKKDIARILTVLSKKAKEVTKAK